ncbi:hypothetical protein AB3Y40_17160 [Yoonia sp. R2331]|uniref:hypothetical protein n=1 Tax=Yoonia sp. R2331 TaxID=3237238 RepID=UPI0034E3E9DF
MEIRDLHYDPRTQAYQAQVCLPHAGRIVTVPTRVKTRKPLRPALLSDILAHRARRSLEPPRLTR